ncbi:MAG: 1-deoxy-D-xylulose-5-phosphate reductoisomerase [Propionibacteriaceae bacterium]|jgi:1-deoxy-D-xylulose-5-phosphate reductoisomerase|nr:1-deoxy-D-xylulose-5-phosphate reductoisomerase [Propionibacteriaceae bacterium]
MRNVAILGATGSIGTQALAVVRSHPNELRVVALAAAGTNVALLAEQVLEFNPAVVAVADPSTIASFEATIARTAADRRARIPTTRTVAGVAGVTAVASYAAADVVLNGITGAAGLSATLAALQAGKTLALANKESLVIGGSLVCAAAAEGQIVPVDSEHSAIAQSLRAGEHGEISRILLTASGGPFRGYSLDELAVVTPAQALQHPTWNMGRVVSINSATMVNKGLEIIEAHLLFGVPIERITVVAHPQSVVHSGVEFVDGALILQAASPDMRLPIALGLTWPTRLPEVVRPAQWNAATAWTFEPVDENVFTALADARRAGELAGSAPAVFNAANEVAVDAFCAGLCGFLDIQRTISKVLDEHLSTSYVSDATLTLPNVLAADAAARVAARTALGLEH